MNNLGIKIKSFRKKLDLTQEELAERLGVSFQAVSKWETCSAYPDIAMLPILANFFNVTTDELLGVDLSKKNEKINSIIAEYDCLSNLGKEKESFDYMAAAHKKYPNDFKIMDKYIWMLCYDPYYDCSGLLKHEDEIIFLCNRILKECPDDKVRYTALSVLGGLYRDKGEIEKALNYARCFPDYYQTEGQEIENIYERGSDKWWESVRNNIYELTELMMVKIRNCALYTKIPPDKRIELLKKAVDLIKMVYDEGDYGFCNYNLCELYIWISNNYIEIEDYENAEKYLDLGLAHSRNYDELDQITVHTSFLVKGHVFDPSKVYSGFEGNDVKHELNYIAGNDFYNQVRHMDWFQRTIDKYLPYARDHK